MSVSSQDSSELRLRLGREDDEEKRPLLRRMAAPGGTMAMTNEKFEGPQKSRKTRAYTRSVLSDDDEEPRSLLKDEQTLRELRAWADGQDGLGASTKQSILGKLFNRFQRQPPPLPSQHDLVNLAISTYPRRGDIRIDVFDFGSGRAERHQDTLGNIYRIWTEKPAWAQVRWIHAPLGLGMLHSSVEHDFLHAHPEGLPFRNAGTASWPYFEFDVLTFYQRQQVQKLRDVFFLLSPMDELKPKLDEQVFHGDMQGHMTASTRERAYLHDKPLGFWDCVDTDMPTQLSEDVGAGLRGLYSGLKPADRALDEQLLSRHPFFTDAQMVKGEFRMFHRGDGMDSELKH